MAIESKKIATVKSYPGQILQELPDSDTRTADNFQIFDGGSGKKYEDIGSRTVHTTIELIRASTTPLNTNILYQTNFNNCPGIWVVDPDDFTSSDNTGTVLVTASGQRLKRKFSGNIDASWFDLKISSNANPIDCSDKLQAALDSASVLGKNVYITSNPKGAWTTGWVYYCFSTIDIPKDVNLYIDQSVTIKAKGDIILFRVHERATIRGNGSIQLYNGSAGIAVFFWGGYDYTLNERAGILGNINIIGDWTVGQIGVLCAVGVNENGEDISNNNGQSVVYLNVAVKTVNIESGLVCKENGTGSGFINGNIFNIYTNCIKSVDITGNGNIVRGQIQTNTPTVRPGYDEYFAVRIFGNNNTVECMVWDWSDPSWGDLELVPAIIVDGDFNMLNCSPASLGYSISGYRNKVDNYLDGHILPPSATGKFRSSGTQDDFFYFADKKYTISKTTSADVTNVFRSGGSVIISDAQNAEKSITIDGLSTPITHRAYATGISIEPQIPAELYVKIEYKDLEGNWTTIKEMTTNNGDVECVAFFKQFANTSSYLTKEIYALKFTFKTNNAQMVINRIWLFADGDPQSFLPVGGGKVLGNIQYSQDEISGTSIDFNGNRDQYVSFISDTTFTGSNIDDGKEVNLIFTNSDASDHTITITDFTFADGTSAFIVPASSSVACKLKVINAIKVGWVNATITSYDSLTINSITSASYLGTDSNGKLIAVSGLDTKPIRIVTAATTLTTDDYTVIYTGSAAVTFTLPDPTTCENQIFVIVNRYHSGDITVSETLREDTSTTTTTIASDTTVTIQSDGTEFWIISIQPN